jgi:hypothetical protein
MREQRAFAAVHEGTGTIAPESVSRSEPGAERKAGDNWRGGWLMAEENGWRIRPVLIRIEDNGGGNGE